MRRRGRKGAAGPTGDPGGSCVLGKRQELEECILELSDDGVPDKLLASLDFS